MTTADIQPFIRSYRPLAQVLDSDLARWVDMYRNRAARDFENFGAISKLLTEFQTFAEDYVNYLSKLLERKLQSSPPPDETTFKDAFRYELTQRLVDEWIAISGVVEQRQLERYQNWLAKVDEMAQGMIPGSIRTGVVAYLGPSTTLRHMPYSSISIASIPRETYSDLDESKNALAHEIGHHVWRITYFDTLEDNRFEQMDLSDFVRKIAFPAKPEIGELFAPWIEEMFADVFGAVKLGEPFAVSMIDNLKERTRGREDLLRNDGVHPIPYLRPILRIRAIQLVRGANLSTDALLQDWKKYAGKYFESTEDRIVHFLTLSKAIFSNTVTPPSPRSFITLKRSEAFLPGDVNAEETRPHSHVPESHEARLDDIEEAIDNVIKRILLPLVPTEDHPKVDFSEYFTLDWLVNKYLPRVRMKYNVNLGDFVILLNALSTLLAKDEPGLGPNSIYVTHSHDGTRHTHNPDNTITTAR